MLTPKSSAVSNVCTFCRIQDKNRGPSTDPCRTEHAIAVQRQTWLNHTRQNAGLLCVYVFSFFFLLYIFCYFVFIYRVIVFIYRVIGG